MFTVGLKLTKKKTVVLAVALIFVFFLSLFVGYKQEYMPTKSAFVCNNADDVATYLKSFDVDCDEFHVDEITVPHEFGEVYSSYNSIQKEQGFDLSEYKGKTLTRYTAKMNNYPDSNGDIFAEVLVYNKLIVGADIYSVSSNGFIVALK